MGQRADRALQLFDEMLRRGIAPDLITYTAAVSACEKMQLTDRAMELLHEMQERSIAPNEITYSLAMSVLKRAQGPDRPLLQATMICRDGPITVFYWHAPAVLLMIFYEFFSFFLKTL